MTPSLLYLPAIIRHFGLSWVGYRFFYALRQRLGLLRRQFPTAKWAARALPQFLRDSAGLIRPPIFICVRATFLLFSLLHPIFRITGSTLPTGKTQTPRRYQTPKGYGPDRSGISLTMSCKARFLPTGTRII